MDNGISPMFMKSKTNLIRNNDILPASLLDSKCKVVIFVSNPIVEGIIPKWDKLFKH